MKALYIGRGGTTAGFVDSVTAEDGLVGVLLDVTSFYYESGMRSDYNLIRTMICSFEWLMYVCMYVCTGGQIFDTGYLLSSDGTKFSVTNAQTYAGYVSMDTIYTCIA